VSTVVEDVPFLMPYVPKVKSRASADDGWHAGTVGVGRRQGGGEADECLAEDGAPVLRQLNLLCQHIHFLASPMVSG
jgi:hypothetical protein